MKAIYRMMSVIPYSSIDEALSTLIQEQETKRTEIRKEALDKINKLGTSPNINDVKEIMDELNTSLSNSYEKENSLIKFIGKIKQ